MKESYVYLCFLSPQTIARKGTNDKMIHRMLLAEKSVEECGGGVVAAVLVATRGAVSVGVVVLGAVSVGRFWE